MEKNKDDDYGEEEDSEYVLLDLEAVRGQIDIPPNAPYTLSLCIDEYGFDFVIFLTGNIAYLIYWYFAVSFEQDCYECQGLDTMNPILIIDKKVKLIGEYEETIGTCFVFSEDEASPVVHEETGPSEANLFSGKYIIDPNQAPRKQVKPVTRLQKILKFRLLLDEDVQVETNSQNNSIL
ncbi:hypothetical protein GOBAR_DD10058 [Gossypium barbadense]|nr:hypothetical protein GOBAR_DD10058 [Gossypium barbadense]